MLKGFEQLLSGVGEFKEIINKIHAELETQRIEASAGAGLVRVAVNGRQEIIEVHIDQELIKMKDKKLLEDLIKSAVNEGMKEAMEVSQKVIKEAIGLDMQKSRKVKR